MVTSMLGGDGGWRLDKTMMIVVGSGIAPVAIIDRQLPFEYTIASRSTDVMVMVLRVEKKLFVIEQPIPPAPAADSAANLHRQFENYTPYEMPQELKSMFEKQAGVERFDLIQTFHACKQEEGKPIGQYVLKMKGYVEQLERLGYVLPQDLNVGLILNGLTSDFAGFAATPQVMAIQSGRIQRANKKSHNAKRKGKGKGKGNDKSYIPKPNNKKNLNVLLKEHPAKDDTCHHCKEGLRGARKLKQGDLYLYMGNGVHAQVEAIGSYDLVLPNGLQLTPPYTPQYNGVSEMRNRTLLDMVRSMMNLTTLPLSFWDYALESAAHILNMVSTKKVYKTPYELWIPKANDGLLFLLPPENKLFCCDDEDIPSEITSEIPMEVEGFATTSREKKPHIPIFANKWLDTLNAEMQSMLSARSRTLLCALEKSYDKFKDPLMVLSKHQKVEYKIWMRKIQKSLDLLKNLDEPSVYQKACGSTFSSWEATFILGIKIYRDRLRRLIGLCQNAYMDKILKRYRMDNSKRGYIPMQERLDLNKTQGASTPRKVKRMQNLPYASAVGSIMYAVRCTRPDVAFAQNITSRFQQNPCEPH
ncbi:retrotransposon protein, putative, ty1-copia subclass [Tanacetum coccineum]